MVIFADFPISLTMSTVIIGILLVVAMYIVYTILGGNHQNALPMAPVGLFHTMQQIGGSQAPFFILEIAQTLGQNCFRLPLPFLGPGGLFEIGDYQLARRIFQDKTTDKPRKVYKNVEGLSGKTMFTSGNHDEYTKSLRKATAHAFSRTEVGRMNAVAKKYVDEWIHGRLLKEFVEKEKPFDPGYELNRITFFVICEAAFEYVATEEEYTRFSHNVEIVLRELTFKQVSNPLRKTFGWFLPGPRKGYCCIRQNRRFMAKVMHAYRKNPNKSSHNTLIKILEASTTIGNDYQRVSEMTHWLFGGHETTGLSIASTITLLAKHPDVQRKLLHELKSATHKPEEVEYFRHVVREAQRVVPVLAMGPIRETGRDYFWKGKTIPKSAICFLNFFLINRDPTVFQDPNDFKPERWEHATPAMNDSIIPFALGPRSCPGQALAMAEINSALPKLLTEYSLELVEEGKLENLLTLKYTGSKVLAKKL
jgi:cytochrome P450